MLASKDVYIIESQDIVRKKESTQIEFNAKPVDWLQIIDYAIIRIHFQQNDFNNLFYFLSTNEIYCNNKKNNLSKLVEFLEQIYENDKKIKFKNFIPGIIVEIQLLKKEYKQALQKLYVICEQNKHTKSKTFVNYVEEKIIEIFQKNQKNQMFEQLLEENFYWLSKCILKRKQFVNGNIQID